MGRCRDPFSERQSLAESLVVAAEKLEGGVDHPQVDEYLRTAIATQPTSGQWGNEFGKIIETATSLDAMIYAKNLRLIAKELTKESEVRRQ